MFTPLSRRAGSLLRPVALLALLFANATSSLRATNYTITASTPETIDLSNVGLQPGDTVFIQAHTRQKLVVQRLTGAPGNPITVTNTGGQFIIDSTTSDKGIQFQGCQYIVVQGTPAPGYEYGIKIAQATAAPTGVSFTTHTAGAVITGSTDFEISNVEIGHVGFAGLMAKNDSLKASSGFVMQNVRIHDLYIHHTGGEAIYVGSSFFNTTDTTSANYNPHHIHDIEIDNNVIEEAGWDGIQLGCATQNASIHHNYIMGYGVADGVSFDQDEGIRSNPGTAADIYNNWIQGSPTGSGTGIFANPYNSVKYYNNVIVTSEESGIYIAEASAAQSYVTGYTVKLMHNTVVAPKFFHCIHLSSVSHSSSSLVKNNLVADPGVYNGVEGFGILIGGGNPAVTTEGNITKGTVAEAGFVDAATDNYHLAPGSVAIDTGVTGTTEVVATDYDDVARPAGAAYDVGAFEFVAVAPAITTQPSGQTVTVGDNPAFAVVATGTPTPTYQWKKNGTDVPGATSATLSLTGVQLTDAGSYTVVVTNSAGSVTSNAAVLSVQTAIGLITPIAYGQAGTAPCPATGTFNEQPTWNGSVPVGVSANPYSGTSTGYANRHWYVDFGANYATLRITGTWTRYMPFTTASYPGTGVMWWDDDNDSTNDNGVTATGLNFGTAQNLNTGSSQPWAQDTNNTGSPVTPQRRYLIINTGPTPPARANEFAISGFTVN